MIQLLIFLSNTGATNKQQFCIFFQKILIIAIIIVPLLTIGFYKNRKFMKENAQDAKVSFEEAYEKN